MEKQRTILLVVLAAICFLIYQRWVSFNQSVVEPEQIQQSVVTQDSGRAPIAEDVPETPPTGVAAESGEGIGGSADIPELTEASQRGQLITVETDLVRATINTYGGTIERLELLREPVSIDRPDEGFPLFKMESSGRGTEVLVPQSGLLGRDREAPNHHTQYQAFRENYSLAEGVDEIKVPLSWVGPDGIGYTKEFLFRRDSYVIDIEYRVENSDESPWTGFMYAQLNQTAPQSEGGIGSMARLPSYTGGAIYTPENKYEKIDLDDMEEQALQLETQSGWVALLQHYFVGAWLPQPDRDYEFYTDVTPSGQGSQYKIGYKTLNSVSVAPGQTGTLNAAIYAGPKEQQRLARVEDERGITGLGLTVDYGWLTFIADPLFWVLAQIYRFVGNWGWAIILLTILIKALFYPLSAASYRSMAAMKKLQPRMATLKERYADDKQKFQVEMMALYKKEKVNPAGGCLPILVQIPVFIALYWVLLESVELRQASFALWWNDLSSPDPYYVLPLLMGGSMFLQQKLNPQPVEPMQQKIMMIMPVVLTIMFISFPQGLVLYWVVNNILSIAQQWAINRSAGAD
jgi:YidC/Oxa1 family membrane protein insertase